MSVLNCPGGAVSGSVGGFGAAQSGRSGAVSGGVGVTQNLGSLDAQGLNRGDAIEAAVARRVFFAQFQF